MSHERIWNQDPWVHQHFSNLLLEQGFDAFKDPIAQAIGQGTLQYFPLYHFLLAGIKGLTGMQNWDVYRFLFVTLPLINIFSTYLLASSLFSHRTGVYAAIIASTSFFQLHNLYFIGLTYNVLFIGLGILTLFFITLDGRTWEYLAVLFALATTFAHVYGILFLLVVIIYKKIGNPYLFLSYWFTPHTQFYPKL
jgi:hypothetical protein